VQVIDESDVCKKAVTTGLPVDIRIWKLIHPPPVTW